MFYINSDNRKNYHWNLKLLKLFQIVHLKKILKNVVVKKIVIPVTNHINL